MPLVRCPVGRRADGFETDWHEPGPFDDLVASWAVEGEGDCDVVVRGRVGGRETAPYVLARRRDGVWSSVAGQADADAKVEVDTLVASQPLDAFRLVVRAPSAVTVLSLAAVTTRRSAPRALSSGPVGRALELAVEPLSQLAFVGRSPELDGGGASWCSPTALTMVLRFHGVEADVPDVARAVYDPVYGGCGNWSLNVAYASHRGLSAVVTRLGSLDESAPLLETGLPLVLSIAAGPGELPGFPLERGTRGHLVVLAGLTVDGDPIVLDPAAPGTELVRRVYPRAPFERAWLAGSGGAVYLVHPPGHRLPPGSGGW